VPAPPNDPEAQREATAVAGRKVSQRLQSRGPDPSSRDNREGLEDSEPHAAGWVRPQETLVPRINCLEPPIAQPCRDDEDSEYPSECSRNAIHLLMIAYRLDPLSVSRRTIPLS
jgi:hypothetical protein